jgi:hypothetical protein
MRKRSQRLGLPRSNTPDVLGNRHQGNLLSYRGIQTQVNPFVKFYQSPFTDRLLQTGPKISGVFDRGDRLMWNVLVAILALMPRFSLFRRPSPDPVTPATPGGLGTFGGVYTPSILTILGVIMYLRFGWVVGNVGLVGTLIIVTLATSITFFTGLSISAIATDRVVRVGGAYYMISRSLGIETGGAVGIPLYFAPGLSVAL